MRIQWFRNQYSIRVNFWIIRRRQPNTKRRISIWRIYNIIIYLCVASVLQPYCSNIIACISFYLYIIIVNSCIIRTRIYIVTIKLAVPRTLHSIIIPCKTIRVWDRNPITKVIKITICNSDVIITTSNCNGYSSQSIGSNIITSTIQNYIASTRSQTINTCIDIITQTIKRPRLIHILTRINIIITIRCKVNIGIICHI